jgi:acyl-coenzyme A thioesterase PaaI-like protein
MSDDGDAVEGSSAIERLQQSLYRSLPIYEHIGITVGALGSIVRCRIPLNHGNGNHFGAVHAALQFAVMELAGGLAVGQCEALRSGDFLLVVKRFSIDFLKPAMTDLEAVATIGNEQLRDIDRNLRAKGKHAFKLEISLINDVQEVVAFAIGEYYAGQK